jgi:archaetidylinositol phosphate synthase
MVSSRFRSLADPYVAIIARPIANRRLNPSVITLSGFGLSVLAATMFASGNLIFASFALLIASFLDVIDGAVARLSNRVTPFGGFLDSVSDRYSDAVILAGIALYLKDHYILIFIVLVGSLLVSYTRARAEKEIEKCDVGVGERAERLVIIIASTLIEAMVPGLNALYWGLVLLAGLTHLTVAERIWFTYAALKK